MSTIFEICERPILFSGPMVRAILEGRKTQTRRVMKTQPRKDATELEVGANGIVTYRAFPNGGSARWGLCPCPYGLPGDRLWVRETFWVGNGSAWGDHCVVYDADKKFAWIPGSGFDDFDLKYFRKMPSIFMPRYRSRLTLEVMKVRVERLQEIRSFDAEAEGFQSRTEGSCHFTVRHEFKQTWNRLNEERGFGWDANPWVWVIEFRRLEQEARS